MKHRSQTVYDRILDAAEKLFSERGYSETTTREIVKEAGSSLSSLQIHFQSKENIFRALLKRSLDPYFLSLEPILSEINCLYERGMLHGEMAWSLLTELLDKELEYMFKPESRYFFSMFGIESAAILDTYLIENEKIQEYETAMLRVCEGYVGSLEAWPDGSPVSLIISTIWGLSNLPRFTKSADAKSPASTELLRLQAKNYLLLTLRPYLDYYRAMPRSYLERD